MGFIVGQLAAPVTADTSGFKSGMAAVHSMGKATAENIKQQFRQVGVAMESVGTKMSAAFTLPLVGAGAMAVKTAADYETLRIQLTTLTGSAEKGADAFQKLKEYSAGTPFQLKDLVKANNTLIGMGESVDDAYSNLQMLGDISSATGANISELAVTFGQASAEGKLMTRDIREFINRGVPMTKLLADSMGVAKSQIFDLAAQGKITFRVMQKALQDATTGTGIYANATEKAAKTLRGVFSTLKDNATLALGSIGESLVSTFDIKGIVGELTTSIQEAMSWFNSLSQQTRETAFKIVGLLGASGPVIAALGGLSLAISAISLPVAGVVAAIGAGAATIISNWEEVETYFTSGGGAQMWSDLKGIVSESVKLIEAIWAEFGDSIEKTIEFSFGAALKTIEFSLGRIHTLMQKFNGDFNTDLNVFEDNILTTLDKIDAKIMGFAGEFVMFLYDQFVTKPAVAIGLIESETEKAASSAKEALSKAKEELFSQLNKPGDIIEPDIQIGDIKMPSSIDVRDITANASAPVRIPVSPIIPPDFTYKMREQFGELDMSGLNLDMGKKILPPDSLGALQKRLMSLREQMQYAADPETMKQLKLQTQLTQEQINQLTGAVTRTAAAGAQMGQMLGNALSQAAFEGRNLLNVIGDLMKRLASQAFISGLTLLLSGGTLGGGGLVGGIMKGILGFASGGRPPTGVPSIVGENGPELFVPDSSGTVIPNHRLQMGSSTSQTIIHNVMTLDGQVVYDSFERARYGRGRG